MNEEELLTLLSLHKNKAENLSHLVDSLEESLIAQQAAAHYFNSLWKNSYNAHRRVLNILTDESIINHETARNKAIQVVNDALRQGV